jgi:peptidoglycan/xylan/chitin deacetylase (PgdA/CDA1 family)
MLTIVMYHYVRDPEGTSFPRIHGRTVAELRGQLDYIDRHYSVVSCADLIAASNGGAPLPERACLLTFDDGLTEHLDTVVPELAARGLTACFAVPADPVLDRRVLDVQKSQHVLAASSEHGALARELLARVEARTGDDDLPSAGELRATYAHAGRYDGPETMFAKRLLQDALPDHVRRAILDELFAELVSRDEAGFADELYLSLDGVRELLTAGMEVSGHGGDHHRLGLLDEAGQQREIDRSLELLVRAHDGTPPTEWTMTYAYGSRNETTLRLLAAAGCRLGLTTDVGLAGPEAGPLELPRLNTNDLPTTGVAPASPWTVDAGLSRGSGYPQARGRD